ncbi:MAG TPA: hypothetical protein VGD02_08385 [Gemmatimonadaceae bacterium]
MTRRLNITNGDSAVGTLDDAGIAGKTIAWRDVLHEGPVDSSLSLSELSVIRAKFIASGGWDDFNHISGDFEERDRAIQHLDYFDEVVLWFEDDLYDQLQLIQLLDFFSDGIGSGKKLTLIQVDGYIPPLKPKELKELDDKRAAVTPDQLQLAERAWRVFGSAEPTGVASMLREDTSALPYLANAFRRHLEEFPSTVNGLSRSEREALTAIDAGYSTPVKSFLEVARQQESIFLGDMVFYSYLERLSPSHAPLLTWSDGRPVVSPRISDARDFVNGEMVVTPLGRDVIAGKRDWQTINKESRWLGGVEIPASPKCWRWDSIEKTLVAPGEM